MKDVVLDDFRIEALSRRPDVAIAFPFFGARVRRDGCCRRGRRDHADYAAVKARLAGLAAADRDRFKGLIGAASVTVYLPAGPDGVVRVVRF